MSDEFQMTVGQAHELEMALRRTGWTAVEVKVLSMGNNLSLVRDVILGRAEVKPVEHLIDCDLDPFISEGWKVEEHRKGGSLKWDPAKVSFYLSESQRTGGFIKGNELRRELAGKPVLNACVLGYLLAHPNLIPEEWKRDEKGRTRYIFFWGTIYRASVDNLYVRCLCWSDGRWSWDYGWLELVWSGLAPAALLASA